MVEKAIEHFTRSGFGGSTRDLARQIGITQPLLYRYFENKEALIERVYNEVFQWRPEWEQQIADCSLPLIERLYAFYIDYSSVILREEWIRLFIFSGLTHEGINDRYMDMLRSKVFLPVLAEIREAFGIAAPRNAAENDAAIEMVWSLHAAIFYLGVRKWVYGLSVPDDMEAVIRQKVDIFLCGAPATLRKIQGATI
ncbi:TetR family transcriptional regulator [Cupriavidus necator]|nr:TetR family transcriptional regulator [Cupriavidus necator]